MKRPDHNSRRAVGRRQARQGGSAMLIVFLFAAVVAIMLYRELPVTLFEAQRQKEQLLVDRGHEYTRAVQLYYRRFRGQYPASIEQLESVNNMRFLRHRFKDPLTGKDDWRLLHAGPGGMLLDSKVNPLKQQNNANGTPGIGQAGANQQTATDQPFGTSQPTAAGASSTDGAEVVVAAVHVRPPAIAANGANSAGGVPTSAELDQNPATPLLPSSDPNSAALANANAPRDQGGQAGPANAAGSGPINNPGDTSVNIPGNAPGNTPGNNGQQDPNAMSSVQNLLSSSANRQQPQQGAFGQNRQPSQFGGGALAGVASKAAGHSIKRVNDQSNYSLWEFYYDPSKDTSSGAGAVGGFRGAPGVTGGFNNSNSNGFNTNSGTGMNNSSGFNNTGPINNDPNAIVPNTIVGTAASSVGGQPSDQNNLNQSPGTPVGPAQPEQ